MDKKKLHYAWFVLLGVIIIRGFAGGGINMTAGLFLSPVSQEIGVGIGTLSIYFSITSVVLVLFLPFAGRIINRYDIRLAAIAGAALQALPFAAFGSLRSVYGWYILAVPQAMGAALLVSLLGPILIHRWFSKNTGLMMGIQMAFVGLFGAVFQPLTSNVIEKNGWRQAYFWVGFITFVVVVITALMLLRNRPEDKGLMPFGFEAPAGGGQNQNKPSGDNGLTGQSVLRSPAFYLLLLFMISITGIGVFTQHIPTYGALIGYSLKQTGAALAFASLGNAIGSIIIGIISDKIGSLKTCYGIIVIGLLAVTGFLFSSQSFLVFGLSTFLHGLVSSGIMVLAPILTLKFFGSGDYEKIYAKVSMGAPIASVVLIPAYGFIYDIMNDYRYVLFGMLSLLVLAFFCIAGGWKKRSRA